MTEQAREPWQDMLTDQQRKILNAACGDLAEQVKRCAGIRDAWRLQLGLEQGKMQRCDQPCVFDRRCPVGVRADAKDACSVVCIGVQGTVADG